MSDEPVYLDVRGVAERIGVKVKTVYAYIARGSIPHPDYRWRNYNFWLEETIDEWRKWRYRPNCPPRLRPGKRPTSAAPELPAAPFLLNVNPPVKQRPKKRPARTRAVQAVPDTNTVSADLAGRVAQTLRSEGHYCTVEDVIALANSDGDGLDRERKLMRDRVLAKLRGFAARV